MRLELMLGLRYLTAKRKASFVSVITIICILGILVGDMVMIVVLSVMNGFQDDIRDKILGMRSHIDIGAYGDVPIKNYKFVLDIVKEDPDVVSAYPYIMLPAIMKSDYFTTLITVRSFEQDIFTTDSDFIKYFEFVEGSSDLSPPERPDAPKNALIGNEMARDYAMEIGAEFNIISASGTFEQGLNAKTERFKVSGIYKTGYYEYDTKMVIVPIETATVMAGYTDSVNGVAVKVKNYLIADKVAATLDKALSEFYSVLPWMRFDRNFFQALRTEKIMLSLILSFIILIAALNIASSQIIFVKDKRRDIAIIKTLGLRPSGVAKVFFLEGAIIGFIGTLLGVITGIIFASNVNETLEGARIILQTIVNVIWFIPSSISGSIFPPIVPVLFPADVYYVTGGLPSIIKFDQVLMVAIISFSLSVVFAIIPAYIASRYKPAAVLRYE